MAHPEHAVLERRLPGLEFSCVPQHESFGPAMHHAEDRELPLRPGEHLVTLEVEQRRPVDLPPGALKLPNREIFRRLALEKSRGYQAKPECAYGASHCSHHRILLPSRRLIVLPSILVHIVC